MTVPTQIEMTGEYDQELLENVHPGDYRNPEPAGRYNLVVVGAGTAGLVAAAGAAGLGARVALVERRFMGGDCLNFGCVPSKGIIRSARLVGELRRAAELGVRLDGGYQVDFRAVMHRMRRLRARVSRHDSVERFSEQLGVDVFLGEARFRDEHSLEVAGTVLPFSRAVIATGSRPARPAIPGLEESGYLTNETVFDLEECPGRMAIIGAGPLGCELAQTFQRLGAQVILIERNDRILAREDDRAAALLARIFRQEGIDLRLSSRVNRVRVSGAQKILTLEQGGGSVDITVDRILVGTGREPEIEHLGLDNAGVRTSRRGVVVDDYLRTSNRRIYAAGDVCLPYKFTHTADATARIVLRNALFRGREKLSALTVPWCIYTDPEIAHVGLSVQEAAPQGREVEVFTRNMQEVDRGVLDGADDGFVSLLVKPGTDAILGATIVAPDAGNMISEITTAMVGGIGMKTLSTVIHPYPTQAEAIKQAADEYNRTRFTPLVKNLFHKWFAWTRKH